MLVDSHCHLDRVDPSRYEDGFDGVIGAAREAGVAHMLCVSIDLESYPAMVRLVEPYADISISVGVHPCERDSRDPSVDELVALAAHPKNVAIGETGLDYYHGKDDPASQHERFRTHVRAARLAAKPLIVHTRAARDDTIAILREEGADAVGGVMHCFTETWEMARAALDLGFYISFSGIVTFRNAAELREVAAKVPLDRLLVETDSPYLAPVPVRGKPNEPRHVRHVAALIAELRGLAPDQLIRQTGDNFFRLFAAARPARLVATGTH